MICLDTNLISEATKPLPNSQARRWFEKQNRSNLFISAPVLMELAYGAERFQIRTGSVRYWVVLEDLKENHYRNRILSFDGEAPLICGRLQAKRESAGRPISVQDAMIASICIANGATLASRNAADFAGLDLKVVNPFEPG